MRVWFKGFHHYYIGVFLMLTGFVVMGVEGTPPAIGLSLIAVGIVIAVDDALQHFIQSAFSPTYHSPLHRAYGWLYKRSTFVRKLNCLADRMFGGVNECK